MSFKILGYEERKDYKLVQIGKEEFYIARQEIADFNTETERLSTVFKKLKDCRNGIMVVPIKNKSRLEEITHNWTIQEQTKFKRVAKNE